MLIRISARAIWSTFNVDNSSFVPVVDPCFGSFKVNIILVETNSEQWHHSIVGTTFPLK